MPDLEMQAGSDMRTLKNASSHFRFGENWKQFSASLSEANVNSSVTSLARLLPAQLIAGRTVLDIGSGSGLSAVAALRLGAKSVTAVDIDANSVATTKATLARFAPGKQTSVHLLSVFELERAALGEFDVVHSWGVLHHTGDVTDALTAAARHVGPDGLFVLSLYRRSPLNSFWISEKRLYTHGPAALRPVIRVAFKSAYLMAVAATGRSPLQYLRNYNERGMNWSNDIHDWLGGYPYEPLDAHEVIKCVADSGFVPDLVIERPLAAFGLFGAPCNEYRFLRTG